MARKAQRSKSTSRAQVKTRAPSIKTKPAKPTVSAKAPKRTIKQSAPKASKRTIAAKARKAPRPIPKLKGTYQARELALATKLGLYTPRKGSTKKARQKGARRALKETLRRGDYLDETKFDFIPFPKSRKARKELQRKALESDITATEKGMFVRRLGDQKPELVKTKEGFWAVNQKQTIKDEKSGKRVTKRTQRLIVGADELEAKRDKLRRRLNSFLRRKRYKGLADDRDLKFSIFGNSNGNQFADIDSLLDFINEYLKSRTIAGKMQALDHITFQLIEFGSDDDDDDE